MMKKCKIEPDQRPQGQLSKGAYVSQSKMLATRRRKQKGKKDIARAAKQVKKQSTKGAGGGRAKTSAS
jgi:hypothetical protein